MRMQFAECNIISQKERLKIITESIKCLVLIENSEFGSKHNYYKNHDSILNPYETALPPTPAPAFTKIPWESTYLIIKPKSISTFLGTMRQ